MDDSSEIFDHYSANYDSTLNKALSISGENKEYFARSRIMWLKKYILSLNRPINSIMDFGCGTGSGIPLFIELFHPKELVGVDVSEKSINIAKRQCVFPGTDFFVLDEFDRPESFDLISCNGVFHHIPPADRSNAISYIWRSLKPGGVFALWENNPWNPGTRYIMKNTPFDKFAITLNENEAKKILVNGGFRILNVDFLFFFPRFLKYLRVFESKMRKIPIGAQYVVICQK
jgi:SAM-dependent methyltransferase